MHTDSYFIRLQQGKAEPPPVTTTLGGAIRRFDRDAGTLESSYQATSEFLNPAGQVQGLIHDIPSCAELVSRIMRDAEAIVRERFEGMLSGARRQAAE